MLFRSDKELLEEAENLLNTKFNDINDIVYDLLEEVKYLRDRLNKIENPLLEDYDDPRYEYGY